MKFVNEEYSSFVSKKKEIFLQFVDCPNIVQAYGGFTSVE
ncbi:hypothetical protein Goari_010003 [Gossypium aridum]|uniref:Uncharacterized protein n=1 Tax=Gossypium aridum TaxID=34290 RepID=A0A7J8Y081_GOSAI|nr:hypothetical protein [Gossypium aridum]